MWDIAFKLHEEVGGSPLKGMGAGMKKILTGSSFLRFSQIDISSVGTLRPGGDMTGKTISGSDVALIREPSSTNGVNLGVNVDNTTSSKPLFGFDRLIGVLTVLVENVSSTETLPTRGPAPEINPTESNALLDSAEKV